MTRIRLLVPLLLVGAGTIVVSQRHAPPAPAMVDAVQALLATLEPAQVEQITIPFDAPERFAWYYTPVSRKGLPFQAMTPPQRQAALELLRVGFSEKGFGKAETIRQLETVLRAIEGRASRDPELYFFSVFGTPSEDGTWGWRYEGHHLSQHWTIVDGTALSAVPQFFGANPAEVRGGPMSGTRVLAAEEELGRTLITSLTIAQRSQAVIDTTAPREIITSNEQKVTLLEDAGIPYSSLDASQQEQLRAILDEYTSAHPPAVAAGRLARIREAGLDRVRFAWMGGLEPGEGHYYRLQGPTFLIEYDNTQNDANHIHTVWREFEGDFGRDLLAEHYRSSPDHASAEW